MNHSKAHHPVAGHKGPEPAISRPSVDKLFIASNSVRDGAIAYAKYRANIDTKDIFWVDDWEKFADRVTRYGSIRELTIYAHGAAGALYLGRHERVLGTIHVRHPPETVGAIKLEGCNIGRDPAEMLKLGRALNASSVSAYTYFHVTQVRHLHLERGQTMASYSYLLRFLLPGQTPRPKVGLDFEWFVPERIKRPPPDSIRPGDLPPRDYYRREDAQASASNGTTDDEAPWTQFQYVTVTVVRTGSKP